MDVTPPPHPPLTAHPDEVDRLLRGLAPAERAQVMDGIRTESTRQLATLGNDPADDRA